MKALSIPGKVLLIGEYAVLAGGHALMAAMPVRFAYSPDVFARTPLRVHAESPAGRLLFELPDSAALIERREGDDLVLRLKREVTGGSPLGVGSSTADFIAIHAMLRSGDDWSSCWRTYRRLHSAGGVLPSGADLAAQWHGGVGVFRIKAGDDPDWRAIEGDFAQAPLILLQASHQPGRKTATHGHLAQVGAALGPEAHPELAAISTRAIAEFQRRDWSAFALGIREFSSALAARGYELSLTREDREALESIPGVLAAKGCGAMLSDTLLVVTDGTSETESAVLELARLRDLRLIGVGLAGVRGVEHSP